MGSSFAEIVDSPGLELLTGSRLSLESYAVARELLSGEGGAMLMNAATAICLIFRSSRVSHRDRPAKNPIQGSTVLVRSCGLFHKPLCQNEQEPRAQHRRSNAP